LHLNSKLLQQEDTLKVLILLFLTSSFIFTSCSSISKSTLVGATTGMAVGAAGGQAYSQKNRGKASLYGALTMGLIGGITGYFTHKQLERRDESVRKETLFNLDKFDVSTPYRNGNGEYMDDNSKQILIFTDDSELFKQLKRN
jgi:hypothetical protein